MGELYEIPQPEEATKASPKAPRDADGIEYLQAEGGVVYALSASGKLYRIEGDSLILIKVQRS